MRARVEKVDVLGWNKSMVGYYRRHHCRLVLHQRSLNLLQIEPDFDILAAVQPPYKGLASNVLINLPYFTIPPNNRKLHSSSQMGGVAAPVTVIKSNDGPSPSSTPYPLYLVKILPVVTCREKTTKKRHIGVDIMDPVTAQHQHYPLLNLIHPFYIPQEWRRNWLNKVELILMSESSRRHQQRPGKGVGRENPPPKKFVVGVEPPLPSTQRYQCGYPEYLIQGWRGRGNDLWWGIKLSEMENTLPKKVYWAIWSRKVLTMTSWR